LLKLSAAYFQPASSVVLSHKSANSTFNGLFSAQTNKLYNFNSREMNRKILKDALNNTNVGSQKSFWRRALMTSRWMVE
jgi:hypothetical protein